VLHGEALELGFSTRPRIGLHPGLSTQSAQKTVSIQPVLLSHLRQEQAAVASPTQHQTMLADDDLLRVDGFHLRQDRNLEIEFLNRLGGEYLALRSMGLFLLGRVAEIEGDWELAAARYEASLRHDRQNADRYVDLARARMNNGQRDEAITAARTAIRLQPGHEPVKGSPLLSKGLFSGDALIVQW